MQDAFFVFILYISIVDIKEKFNNDRIERGTGARD